MTEEKEYKDYNTKIKAAIHIEKALNTGGGNRTVFMNNRIAHPTDDFDLVESWPDALAFLSFQDRLLYRLQCLKLNEQLQLRYTNYQDVTNIESVRRRIEQCAHENCNKMQHIYGSRFIETWLPTAGSCVDPALKPDDPRTRDNLYKLCSALNLDYGQTEEIFQKVLLSPAFILKNRDEAFYCYAVLSRDKDWYGYANSLIEQLPKPDVYPHSEELNTALIKEQCEEWLPYIGDEQTFLNYIKTLDNMGVFTPPNKFVTGRKYLKTLFDKCWEIALREDDSMNLKDYKPDKNSKEGYTENHNEDISKAVNRLLTLILGYNFNIKGNYRFAQLNKAIIPAYVSSSFPTSQTLSICLNSSSLNDKQVSAATLRKSLILLSFYATFGRTNEQNEDLARDSSWSVRSASEIRADYYVWLDTTNAMLDNKLNIGALYAQNPYDALFMFCASQKNPLSSLRMIIDKAVKAPPNAD